MFKSIKTCGLAVILVATTVFAHAQKKITEGTVTYEMDSPAGKMDNKVKFNGSVSMLVMQQGPATISIITDNVQDVGMVLVDVPVAQQMLAAKMTKDDILKERAKVPQPADFKATAEKAVIAGYNAEKYTYTAGGNTYDVWTTKDVELPGNTLTSAFKNVPGTIVKFTGSQGTISLKSVKEEKVTVSATEAPKGYEVMTYAELSAMGG